MEVYDFDRLMERVSLAIELSSQVERLCVETAEGGVVAETLFSRRVSRIRELFTEIEAKTPAGAGDWIGPLPTGVLKAIAKSQSIAVLGSMKDSSWLELAFACQRLARLCLPDIAKSPDADAWMAEIESWRPVLSASAPQWQGFDSERLTAECRREWCIAAEAEIAFWGVTRKNYKPPGKTAPAKKRGHGRWKLAHQALNQYPNWRALADSPELRQEMCTIWNREYGTAKDWERLNSENLRMIVKGRLKGEPESDD